MNPTGASPAPRVTRWDRAAVAVLGGAGCALSFSALQQMAVAIHIRPALCWLFPLVIDGFIAYGVRALLVLRTAPLRARLYVWMLFGTATAVSVWANALHAVRLNQQTGSESGLRLGGMVVAVLSTVAPLALAGAVHLYILIARGPDRDRGTVGETVPADHGQRGRTGHSVPVRRDQARQCPPRSGQDTAGDPVAQRVTQPADRPSPSPVIQPPDNQPITSRPVTDRPVTGHPVGGHPVTARPVDAPPVAGRPVASAPVGTRRPRTAGDRQHAPDTEELLAIARSAVGPGLKPTRRVVAQAIRGQGIPLSNDTLTQLMVRLREQPGQPVTAFPDRPDTPPAE